MKIRAIKFIALILTILSVLISPLVYSNTAFASESETETDDNTFSDGILTYSKQGNMTVTIKGCEETATNVTVLDSIDGYTITGFEEAAFSNCVNLKTITINAKITSMGEGVFYGCTSLEKVEIPGSIKEIPSGTFAYCTALKNVKLNNGTETIDSMAFSYCQDLKTVELPKSIKTLGDYAFMYCTGLEKETIPSSIKKFGSGTFYGCSSLKSFNIPKTLSDIGTFAFFGCTSLTEITSDNDNYIIKDKMLYSSNGETLLCYPAGLSQTKVTIPDGTKYIDASAFFSASKIEEITFDTDLLEIGEGAFDFCDNLIKIEIPQNVTKIDSMSFSDCKNLREVYLPEGLESIGERAFYNDTALSTVTVPSTVKDIGDYAFGFTENEDETDSDGNNKSEKINGFRLMGYSGTAAKKYASKSNVKFTSLNFDMSRIVFIIILAAICIFVAVIVSMLVHRHLMSNEEKTALAAAEAKVTYDEMEEKQKEKESKKSKGTDYKSIVDDEKEMLHHDFTTRK